MRGVAVVAVTAVLALPAATARGEPANGGSFDASISGDGRYVAFDSAASNLVGGDSNGQMDVFVRDRLTARTQRVSVGPQSAEANERSFDPTISADGRYVAFVSLASNLVPGDTNDKADIFVHDRTTGATELLGGGNDESGSPSISADGRYVAFLSYASNLVPGDVGGTWDAFVRDRANGAIERVNISSDEAPAASGRRIYTKATISANGRFVAFSSDAANLVDSDTNGTADVFVRDRLAGTTERVSLGQGGWQLNADNGIYGAAISADGRYVTFISNSRDVVTGDQNGLPDIFVRDRVAGTTERVDVATDGTEANDGVCCDQAISADGRHVAFMSFATNIAPGDANGRSDVFLHDRVTGTTERVSVGAAGEANDQSGVADLNANGSIVLFQSAASNLVGGDINQSPDVFVRERTRAHTELISVAPGARPQIDATDKSPRPPRAGRLYTVTMHVSADGEPVTEATVSGKATVRGRSLPLVRKSFTNSAARCVWRIPRSARNRYITISITIRTTGGGIAGTFNAIVR
jgi:Tol biopolymer transport system component